MSESRSQETKSPWMAPFLLFLSSRVGVFIVALTSFMIMGREPPAGHHLYRGFVERPGFPLDVFLKWDSYWFLSVAVKGYITHPSGGTNATLFPLFPYAMRGLGNLLGSYPLAGVIISHGAFLLSLLVLHALVREETDGEAADWTLAFLVSFPTAFIFSMAYSESLFLLLVLLSFYFANRGRWLHAALFGLLASMTRFVGVALLPALLVHYLEDAQFHLRNVRWNIFLLGLIPLGTMMVAAIQLMEIGDPLGFMGGYAFWERRPGAPWSSIVAGLRSVAGSDPKSSAFHEYLHYIIFTGLFLSVLVLGIRRMRWSHLTFFALGMLLPLSSGNILGISRYILPIFPFFMMLGTWGRRPSFRVPCLIIFLLMQGLYLVLFENWHFSF